MLKDLSIDLFGIVGAFSLVVAGWIVAPPLGIAIFGILSLLTAALLARIEAV